MGLNIKNPATEQSIRKLAAEMGVSLTEAVDRAVSEKLVELQRAENFQKDLDTLLSIARDSAARFSDEERAFDWDAYLYDENGLPK